MREKYLSLSLGTLKELAKARGMKGISTLKKSELIERMLQEDEKEKKIEKREKSRERRNFKYAACNKARTTFRSSTHGAI